MRGIFVLLLLLNVHKVSMLPYQADMNGKCINPAREFFSEVSNLCCEKCPPGKRLIQHCSETNQSVCEQCDPEQYLETWNYSPNCFSCPKCKTNKGQQYAQNCSSTTMPKCKCQPGMYCAMGFDDPYCAVCQKYSVCKAGYGVSVPGKANSNVKCKRCPDGTFSDTVSSTHSCWPHTNCLGMAVIRKGNSTSDTVCKPQTQTSHVGNHEILQTTSSSMTSIVSGNIDLDPSPDLTKSTMVTTRTKNPIGSTDNDLDVTVGCITGVILLFISIAVILLVLYKPIWKKDAARFHSTADENGPCKMSIDKINGAYVGETQMTSPEQHCLLQNGEASSNRSQRSSNTETLTATERCSSHESIGPLQSTMALHPCSPLSESVTSLSNPELIPLQPGVSRESTQPTNPQVVSPGTTRPHVNVNITFHIRNGSCATLSVTPTDLMQTDSQLPFGEEEECSSIPQQEAGKQSLMSVQESDKTAA